jgi:hypothetical protein
MACAVHYPERRVQRFDVESNHCELLRIWAQISTRCREYVELGSTEGRGGRRRLASELVAGALGRNVRDRRYPEHV